jgi:hypothetical protein
MGIFGGPCKHLVNFDKTTLGISGFTGPDILNVKVADIKVDRQVLQTATEITQLYDVMQYSDCIKIDALPKDSPDRVKLTYQVIQNEQQVVQLALLIKLLAAQPSSEKLQQAIAEWIAAQSSRLNQLPTLPTTRSLHPESGGVNVETVRSSIRKAAATEPRLKKALEAPTKPDLGSYFE